MSGMLYIVAGGHNSRIGNHLPVLGKLLPIAEAMDVRLAFPFIESTLNRIFSIDSNRIYSPTAAEIEAARLLIRNFGGQLRSSVDISEIPGTAIGYVDLDYPRCRIILAKQSADWTAALRMGVFSNERMNIVEDPFPFTKMKMEEAITQLKRILSVRPEILIKPKADHERIVGADRLGHMDICLHWRRGDFKHWAGGARWYEEALIQKIVKYTMEAYQNSASITIVSDEPVPNSMAEIGVNSFSGALGEDIMRLAFSDLVLSNGSTMASVSAAIGRVFLNTRARFVDLGNKAGALSTLEKSLSRL